MQGPHIFGALIFQTLELTHFICVLMIALCMWCTLSLKLKLFFCNIYPTDKIFGSSRHFILKSLGDSFILPNIFHWFLINHYLKFAFIFRVVAALLLRQLWRIISKAHKLWKKKLKSSFPIAKSGLSQYCGWMQFECQYEIHNKKCN